MRFCGAAHQPDIPRVPRSLPVDLSLIVLLPNRESKTVPTPIAIPPICCDGETFHGDCTTLELQSCAKLEEVALRAFAVFELVHPARVEVEMTLPHLC